MSDAPPLDPDDEGGGHGGRIVLLVLAAAAVGLVVLRRRSAAKRKRAERERDERLRVRGFDVARDKVLRKGLDRTAAQVALTQRRIKHDLTGD
jgi:saccharopine dehydrogenase-like NADP-dependent oxidoreductase